MTESIYRTMNLDAKKTRFQKDSSGFTITTFYPSIDGKTGWEIMTTKGMNKRLYTSCQEVETASNGMISFNLTQSRRKTIQQLDAVVKVTEATIRAYHAQGLQKFQFLTDADFKK